MLPLSALQLPLNPHKTLALLSVNFYLTANVWQRKPSRCLSMIITIGVYTSTNWQQCSHCHLGAISWFQFLKFLLASSSNIEKSTLSKTIFPNFSRFKMNVTSELKFDSHSWVGNTFWKFLYLQSGSKKIKCEYQYFSWNNEMSTSILLCDYLLIEIKQCHIVLNLHIYERISLQEQQFSWLCCFKYTFSFTMSLLIWVYCWQ